MSDEATVDVDMEWTIRHVEPRGEKFPDQRTITSISRDTKFGYLCITSMSMAPGGPMEAHGAVIIPPAMIEPLRRCLNGVLMVVQQPDPQWERPVALVSPRAGTTL